MQDLVTNVEDLDFDSFGKESGFLGFLQKAGAKVKRFLAQYEKLEVQVDRIEGKLEEARMEMLKDIGMFDSLYEKNLNYFKQLQESQGASQDQIGDAIGNLGSDVKKNQQVILDSLTTHDAANKEGQQAIKDAIAQHNTNVMAEQERLANAITGNQSNVQEYLEQLKNALERVYGVKQVLLLNPGDIG